MASLEDLKQGIGAEKAKKKGIFSKKEEATDSMNIEQVEHIVDRMKKKYAKEGIEFEEVSGKLGELRGIIASGEYSKIKVQSADDLAEFRSPMIRQLGKIYLIFKRPLDALVRLIRNMPFSRHLAYNLYSANMKYSVQQFLVLAVVVSAISFFFVLLLSSLVVLILDLNPLFAALPAILAAIMVFAVALIIPGSKAKARADAMSVELPFALRHMATELKSGIGLYKTLQAIATADYGVLSQEFARTINEIEEGTDAKDALRHFALRTQCKSLRNALLQIIRALKTGGNLSGIMNQIAEDVSFELGMRIRDFGEKMNFFGVLFIVGAIVMPVFVAILGAIFNTPFGVIELSLSPIVILMFYVVIMPIVLSFLVLYLKMIEPKV